MYNVLILTHDPAGRKPLKTELLAHGYGVACTDLRELFKDAFDPGKTDLVVADLESAGMEAHKLCHTIKQDPALKELPLVLLVPEDLLGRLDFSWGVDDYLTLPVSPKRLAERVKFLMWKINKVELKDGLKIGDLAVDFSRYEVHVNGAPVDLTYKEFELLKFLATHPGRVFSREALLSKVWGYDYYGGTRTVDVHVRRLRAKIETGGRFYVQTVRNVGYKFVTPI